MNILEQIQNKLKELNCNSVHNPIYLPNIRYFDGNDMFSTIGGQYSAKTLEGSLELFYNELCIITK